MLEVSDVELLAGKGRLSRAGGQTAAALADQIVVSGNNVLSTIIVGRVLGAGELGIYSLVFAAVVLANSVVDFTFSSSYLISSQSLSQSEQRGYSAGSLGLALVLALVLAAATWSVVALQKVVGATPIAASGPAAALFALAFLLRELLRRYEFAKFRPLGALSLDAIATALQFGLVAALIFSGLASLTAIMLSMAVANGATALIMLLLRRAEVDFRDVPVGRIARDVVRLSSWVLPAHVLLVVGLQMMPWLVSIRLGTAAVGVYSASMTLANLPNPIITGFLNVMMPAAAAAYAKGPQAVWRGLASDAITLFLVTGLICAGTAVFAGDLIRLAFGTQFGGSEALVWVLAATFLIRSTEVGAYVGCWAIRRSDLNVIANGFVIIFGAGAALVLMPSFNLLGAGLGQLGGSSAAVVVRWITFHRSSRATERASLR